MKNVGFQFLLLIILAPLPRCHCQAKNNQGSNDRLSQAAFRQLATRCAPNVPLVTLHALVSAESSFHPFALSLDYPHRTAREQGLMNGEILLARQPKNLAEARMWTDWFLRHHRSVSIGLAQISTQQLGNLGLTLDQLFDPCTNIQAGERLLTARYQEAAATLGEGQAALYQALSEYNSGSRMIGFENGYVARVLDGEVDSREP